MSIRAFWKQMLIGACTGLLLLQPAIAADIPAPSTAQQHPVILKLNDPGATVDGKTVTLQAAPVLMNRTTMVPLRFVSESLGVEVKWDGASKSITMSRASQTIQLTIDQSTASVNGNFITMEQPPIIVKETTMVPLRFVAEVFNQTVAYDNDTLTITITDKSASAAPATAPTVSAKKQLDKLTVDNLTYSKDRLGNSGPGNNTARFIDMTSDNNGNVYLLYFDPNRKSSISQYVILKYNERDGDANLQNAVSFDMSFKLQVKETNQTYLPQDMNPKRMYYDEAHDRLYVLVGLGLDDNQLAIYEVLPTLRMIAYNAKSPHNHSSNFVAFTDDEHFYYSDVVQKNIYYSTGANENKTSFSYMIGDKTPNFVSTVSKGQVYLFDRANMAISQIESGGIRKIADVKIDNLFAATARDGAFYAASERGIYCIGTDGTVEPFVTFKDLVYNKGLFDPVTKTYKPIFNDAERVVDNRVVKEENTRERTPIVFGFSSLFTLNGNGNVILYDSGLDALRRINVYR
jgi:hypothetical protein